MGAKQMETEIKVGMFVALGVILLCVSILLLGGASTLVMRQNKYTIHFPNVDGLITGSKVVLGGLGAGRVSSVDFDNARRDIVVEIEIQRKFEQWIRKDTIAEVATQGVMGDKYVILSTGDEKEPILPNGSEIETRPGKDLKQWLSQGDQLMASMTSIASSLDRILKTFEAKNRTAKIFEGMADTAQNLSATSAKLREEFDQIQLKSTMANLKSVLEKVNNGTGTLGALVNDPSLYYDVKSLMGGANRNRIVRNLVRKTIKDAHSADADAEATEVERKPQSDGAPGAAESGATDAPEAPKGVLRHTN